MAKDPKSMSQAEFDKAQAKLGVAPVDGPNKPNKVVASNDGTQAFKGYLIKVNPLSGGVYISKDGAHISSAPSVDGAKKIILDLVK